MAVMVVFVGSTKQFCQRSAWVATEVTHPDCTGERRGYRSWLDGCDGVW